MGGKGVRLLLYVSSSTFMFSPSPASTSMFMSTPDDSPPIVERGKQSSPATSSLISENDSVNLGGKAGQRAAGDERASAAEANNHSHSHLPLSLPPMALAVVLRAPDAIRALWPS